MIGQLEQQWQDFSGMYLNIGHLYIWAQISQHVLLRVCVLSF